jgi:biofilm PGA synthesis N-glycosyltransferase PgaC
MASQRPKLLLVSPVFNEAANLARTARAVAAQTRPPDRWIVVDDGSADETLAIARELEREIPFLSVIEAGGGSPTGADNLALAREARAFNLGLDLAGWRSFDFIGKLDGDVELPPRWFERLVGRLGADPRLGVAGGYLVEDGPSGWERIAIPAYHVHGAVKLFRRECLEAIGGIQERLAWDTIDETYARMNGYRSHSFDDLVARHHRPWGSADGQLRGCARHGECAWILHYGLLWVALRSAKVALSPPRGLSGLTFFLGYVKAAARRVPRVEDAEFRRFVRAELRERLLAPLPGRGDRPVVGTAAALKS